MHSAQCTVECERNPILNVKSGRDRGERSRLLCLFFPHNLLVAAPRITRSSPPEPTRLVFFLGIFLQFAWVGAKLDIYANDTNAMCCSFFHITGASRAFLRDLADDIWSMRLEKPQTCKHVELQVHFLPTATIPKKEDLAQEIP